MLEWDVPDKPGTNHLMQKPQTKSLVMAIAVVALSASGISAAFSGVGAAPSVSRLIRIRPGVLVAPGYKAPGYRPPVTPAYRPPVTPAYRPPVTPAYKAPVTPGYKAPGYRPPVKPVTPGYKAPGYRR